MASEEIERLRKLLKYRNQERLAELLKDSYAKIYQSTTFGNYYNSVLGSFDIYSPLWAQEELKKLTEEEKSTIFGIVLEIYPPKEESIEFYDVRFFLDVDIDSTTEGDEFEEGTVSLQNNSTYDIFVSHSHQDYEQVKNLTEMLKEYGFTVFLAHQDIRPSTEWVEEIFKALNSSRIFVAYITQDFKQSNWCDQETGIAFVNEEKIVPIIASTKANPYGFIGKYQGIRLPTAEKYHIRHINTVADKLSVSIVETLYNDPKTQILAKDRIFQRLNHITSYHQTDLIFSVLERIGALTDNEIQAIIEAYDTNTQISNAKSADSFVQKLRMQTKE